MSNLIDVSTLPQPREQTIVVRRGDVCPGVDDEDTVILTIWAHLGLSESTPTGVPHDPRWDKPVKGRLPPVKEAASAAIGLWFGHELPADDTLSARTALFLFLQKNRMHKDLVDISTKSMPLHVAAYNSRDSLWRAVTRANTELDTSPLLHRTTLGKHRPRFTFPYASPAVGHYLAKPSGQPWASVHLEHLPAHLKDPTHDSSDVVEMVDDILLGLKVPWDALGKVDTRTITLGELLPVTLLALPIANRLDRQLARDLAHLTALLPGLEEVTDELPRIVQTLWVYHVLYRVKRVLDAVRSTMLFEACAEAASLRLRMMDKQASENHGIWVIMPYLGVADRRRFGTKLST